MSKVFLNFSCCSGVELFAPKWGEFGVEPYRVQDFRSLECSVPFGVIIVYHTLKEIDIDKTRKNMDKYCAAPGRNLLKI